MIKKQFLKSKPVCKTTFVLPREAAPEAKEVYILGSFNDWDVEKAVKMKKLKSGDFKATIDLETGKEYEFRYLIDGRVWENDAEADKYVPTPFGVENSVVVCLN